MTTPAATLATFADFRIVKTRKLAQFVFELPIEKADEALAALGGLPRSDNERWCGIALMNSAAPSAETGRDTAPDAATPPEAEAQGRDKPRRAFHTMPRSQQAGILCIEPQFQFWCCRVSGDVNATAEYVRINCGVKSRAELDTNKPAGRMWDDMVFNYHRDTGQMAEQR